MPLVSAMSLRASTLTPRWSPIRSQTTSASFVWPSSSTRQRACSSSWTSCAGNGAKPPTINEPSSGVRLLVAAPARRGAVAAWVAVRCASAQVTARIRGKARMVKGRGEEIGRASERSRGKRGRLSRRTSVKSKEAGVVSKTKRGMSCSGRRGAWSGSGDGSLSSGRSTLSIRLRIPHPTLDTEPRCARRRIACR